MKKSSLLLGALGLALLLVIGGFASFAENRVPTTPGTPLLGSVVSPSVDTGCLAASVDSGDQAFSSDEKTPMTDPCAGVFCQTNADCQSCCEAGGYDLWHCQKLSQTNHRCICAWI